MESVNAQKMRSGFTLVELLVVLALLSLVLAISASSLSKVSGAALLTSTGDNVVAVLSQAQQDAIADNSSVEVRVYEPVDTDALISIWSIVSVRENEDGTHRIVGAPVHLPNGVILNQTEALSSLVGGRTKKTDSEMLISKDTGVEREYTSFEFFSNGATSLPATSGGDTWHLTLMESTGDGKSSSPPANFFTVRVDPFTGAIRTFRP